MSRVVRKIEEYEKVMLLLKTNNMVQVSKLTGIPQGTIKNWKIGRSRCYESKFGDIPKWNKDSISERIRTISDLDFQKMLDNSQSLSDLLRKFNVDRPIQYYVKLINDRIGIGNLDLTLFNLNKNNRYLKPQNGFITNDEMFVINSKISRSIVRNRIIKHKLINYCCVGCGLINEYNGKPLTLQLDHINGIRDDNRLENLRWLCPNCHSQQDTSFGRNKKQALG